MVRSHHTNTASQNAPARICPLASSFEPILTLHAIPYWYHYRRCRETGGGCSPRSLETQLHDPSHYFEETRDGPYVYACSDLGLICCPICCNLNVTHVRSPFFLPGSLLGLFHILFAHLRQLYLVLHLLFMAKKCDVYIVDQLTTRIPFIRVFLNRRVVFYCHFSDKLLADGEYLDNDGRQELGFTRRRGFLKRVYRFPMNYWEGLTTSYSSPTHSLLQRSSYCISPLSNRSRESAIPRSMSRSTKSKIRT